MKTTTFFYLLTFCFASITVTAQSDLNNLPQSFNELKELNFNELVYNENSKWNTISRNMNTRAQVTALDSMEVYDEDNGGIKLTTTYYSFNYDRTPHTEREVAWQGNTSYLQSYTHYYYDTLGIDIYAVKTGASVLDTLFYKKTYKNIDGLDTLVIEFSKPNITNNKSEARITYNVNNQIKRVETIIYQADTVSFKKEEQYFYSPQRYTNKLEVKVGSVFYYDEVVEVNYTQSGLLKESKYEDYNQGSLIGVTELINQFTSDVLVKQTEKRTNPGYYHNINVFEYTLNSNSDWRELRERSYTVDIPTNDSTLNSDHTHFRKFDTHQREVVYIYQNMLSNSQNYLDTIYIAYSNYTSSNGAKFLEKEEYFQNASGLELTSKKEVSTGVNDEYQVNKLFYYNSALATFELNSYDSAINVNNQWYQVFYEEFHGFGATVFLSMELDVTKRKSDLVCDEEYKVNYPVQVFEVFTNNHSHMAQKTKFYWSNGDYSGVSKSSLVQKPNVYPNPTNGVLKINSQELIENVQVYDLAGKVVNNLTLGANNEINVISLPNGMYVLKWEQKGEILSTKFIKQ